MCVCVCVCVCIYIYLCTYYNDSTLEKLLLQLDPVLITYLLTSEIKIFFNWNDLNHITSKC